MTKPELRSTFGHQDPDIVGMEKDDSGMRVMIIDRRRSIINASIVVVMTVIVLKVLLYYTYNLFIIIAPTSLG